MQTKTKRWKEKKMWEYDDLKQKFWSVSTDDDKRGKKETTKKENTSWVRRQIIVHNNNLKILFNLISSGLKRMELLKIF